MTKFNVEGKSLNITTIISIPCVDNRVAICADPVYNAHQIVEAFRTVIIDSLTRRMDACLDQLLSYRKNVVYNDGMSIIYTRNDGSQHTFHVPSYETMEKACDNLRIGDISRFCEDVVAVDQVIKALLNDPELSRNDEDGYKFSELVSVLTELHMWSNRS